MSIFKNIGNGAHRDFAEKMKGKQVNHKAIDISKIDIDEVPFKNPRTGEKSTITVHPKRTHERIQRVLDEIFSDPDSAFLKVYLEKPIIFTYECETAMTDGVRIFMSPVFAEQTLQQSNRAVKKWDESPESLKMQADDFEKYVQTRFAMQNALLKFVIIHECYHMVYNHIYRMQKHLGNGHDAKWKLSNIATDLEINRDIEACFDGLKGCTEQLNGIWYLDEKYKIKNGDFMKKDVCEDIYDLLLKAGVQDNGANQQLDPDNNPQESDEQEQDTVDLDQLYKDGWAAARDSILGNMLGYDDIIKLI